MLESKVISRTTAINTTDLLYLQQNYDVLLIGKDDKSVALLQNGKIIPLISQTMLMDSIATNIELPISAYEAGKLTIQRVASANTTTAPVPNQTGLLTTYRFVDDAFSYQEWKSMMSTSTWRRVWDKVNSVWGVWGQ